MRLLPLLLLVACGGTEPAVAKAPPAGCDAACETCVVDAVRTSCAAAELAHRVDCQDDCNRCAAAFDVAVCTDELCALQFWGDACRAARENYRACQDLARKACE